MYNDQEYRGKYHPALMFVYELNVCMKILFYAQALMDLGEVSLLDTEPLPVEGEPPVRPTYTLVAAGSQNGKDMLFHDDK